MTPTELALRVDVNNCAILHASGLDSEEILALMNKAGLAGVKIGADLFASMAHGNLAVLKAKLTEAQK